MSAPGARPVAGRGHAVVADLNGLGGFFALHAPPPAGSDAVPWEEVLSAERLGARFQAVREALAARTGLPVAAVDPKVAVSATQVGLASRLWSVGLASAVLSGWVPDLAAPSLRASPVHGGSVPLGVADPDRGYAVPDPVSAADVLVATVTVDALGALDEACATVGRTPARVLASNGTSALVGAARVLAARRPDRAAQAWSLTRLLLARPPVTAGGEVRRRDQLPHGVGGAMERPDEAFLRAGCCVFYRLPGHGLCPDCVLAPSRPEQVTPGDH